MQFEGLAPGTRVAGTYVVERTIGRGGMGAVYVVSHVNTGKRMAMKCLLSEFVQNADLVGRFLREAQVMGRLQHRHVVDVFDVGRDGDILYIVMELLEGKPFSDVLHDSTLTLEETLAILLRAMEGVAAAHDRGVIHRDLKPDNIFVCVGASGRLDDPRVLDFGISKLEDAAGDPLTRTGIALGTPYYMSIEQLKGQRDLDARVDVYALGVILYEAIAGSPPFEADSVSALAIKVLTTEPLALGGLRPDLPDGLADVVMKAIARERQDRYRSVRALIEALRPYVPKSAGLLVPEGQGRPLRTPRGAGYTPDGVASRPPSGGVGVRSVDPFASAQRTPSGIEPGAGRGQTTPLPVISEPATPRRSKSWRGALLATVVGGLAVSGAYLYKRANGEPAAPALPTSAPVSSTVPTSPAALPVQAPSPHDDTKQAAVEAAPEARAEDQASEPEAEPATPSGKHERKRASTRRELGARQRVSHQDGSPSQPPAAKPVESEPKVPSKRAEGRAGSIGSDEF